MTSPALITACRHALSFVVVIVLASCTRYHEHPLDAAAIDQSLAVPDNDHLRVATSALHHPLLPAIAVDVQAPLSPQAIAVLAVVLNPSLRALRDQCGISAAQVVQAGILPNPQLSANIDKPTGGASDGTVNAFGIGLNWDVTALISRGAKTDAANSHADAVVLDIAWQEWQIAEAASLAAWRELALDSQIEAAESAEQAQSALRSRMRQAVTQGQRTVLDGVVFENAATDAQATLQQLRSDRRQQQFLLNHAIGLAPTAHIVLETTAFTQAAASAQVSPQVVAWSRDIGARRLDLIALRRGYDSQEATLRAAILAQFPRLSLGILHGRDTGNVVTSGVGIGIEVPIFDRNQGNIAIETATRQKLYDEYAARLFDARADIAQSAALVDALVQRLVNVDRALFLMADHCTRLRQAAAAALIDQASVDVAMIEVAVRQQERARIMLQWVEARVALELAIGCSLPLLSSVPSPSSSSTEPVSPRPEAQP